MTVLIVACCQITAISICSRLTIMASGTTMLMMEVPLVSILDRGLVANGAAVHGAFEPLDARTLVRVFDGIASGNERNHRGFRESIVLVEYFVELIADAQGTLVVAALL